jgi:hypothetical protein
MSPHCLGPTGQAGQISAALAASGLHSNAPIPPKRQWFLSNFVAHEVSIAGSNSALSASKSLKLLASL